MTYRRNRKRSFFLLAPPSSTGLTPSWVARLERTGLSAELRLANGARIQIGEQPARCTVRFHDDVGVRALARGDHLALAEAYLEERIDLDGDIAEALRASAALDLSTSLWARFAFALRFALDRRRFQRESISFHYDRPPEFFFPWFDRTRSYSHGLYERSDDSPERAQQRKLEYALDALDLRPGMRAFDMGCGWGSFLEHAGRRGVHVHGITISREQQRFCERLIAEQGLPCRVEFVDFLDFEPRERFDAAVFMGTFEHFPDYTRAARFLARWLLPGGRMYADFCTQRRAFRTGAFMRKYVWPGVATYVNMPALVQALTREGFNIHALHDDTASYAATVRDWGDCLASERKSMVERFGEREIRVLELYLRGSQHFLETNRTQAYHLVAGRGAAPVGARGSIPTA